MDDSILGTFESGDGTHSVVLEDDGRVAYGYLLEAGVIVSDVWLYNRGVAPDTPEWTSADAEMPFANSRQYAAQEPFTHVRDISECWVEWGCYDGEHIAALVRIRDRVHALLAEGEKPGYCRLAHRSGPLAKCFTKEIERAFKRSTRHS